MMEVLKRVLVAACLATLAACESSAPTEPVVIPNVVAGDYELIASGETTSNAWDTYTIRFEGTVRLEQDPVVTTKLSGAFTDLRFIEGDGLFGEQRMSGVIAGSIDASGSLILQLTSPGNFTWTGRGSIVDSQIIGQWQSSYPAAGGFTARLKPPGEAVPANKAPGFSHLEVSPATVTLLPTEVIDIEVVPRDTKGNRTTFPAPVRYSSSAPEVAAVSTSGLVTAMRPGTAEIVVDVSSDGIDRKAVVRVTVVLEIAYPDIDGVYDVDAPFTHFDPIWGEMTGYRYKAVITLKRDAQGPGLGGTFADFVLLDAAGQADDWRASGDIRGVIARDGRITIGFVASSNSLTWELWGRSDGTAIEGTWFRGGHLSGTFRAVRR